MPQTVLDIATSGPGLYEFTDRAELFVAGSGVEAGLPMLYLA